MTFFGSNSLKCVSVNNQECKVKPEMINTNGNESLFYPYSVKISKRCGICNIINDQYENLRDPDVVKKININVFNLMSRTNETRYIKWHEASKCKQI